MFSAHNATGVVMATASGCIFVLFILISNVLVNYNSIKRTPLTSALCWYHLYGHSTNIDNLRAVLILSLYSHTKESARAFEPCAGS